MAWSVRVTITDQGSLFTTMQTGYMNFGRMMQVQK